MKRPIYIGEVTGDNLMVSPEQLLDMIRRDIDDLDSQPDAAPVKGLFAVVVREAEDGTLHLENYRCGLPKFVEIAVIHRTCQRVMGNVIQD